MKIALELALSPIFVAYDLFRAMFGHRYKVHIFALLDIAAITVTGFIITALLSVVFFYLGPHPFFVIAFIYLLTSIGSFINLWFFIKSRG